MRIAHFGTFDVQNYGDLLFPLILEHRLADMGAEFVHASPLGGPPIWDDCVPTVPAAELMREPAHLTGVVIGGGHIVTASPDTVARYATGDLYASLAYPLLWFGAASAAARGNLPLCWNAPGAPGPLDPVASRLLRWSGSVSDYIAVRDHRSQQFFVAAGVERRVDVVPDTALDVARLWTADELAQAHADVFARRARSVPERSIVVHLNDRYLYESPVEAASRLDRICRNLDATALLIALGPCHGDAALQRRVAQRMTTGPVLVDAPQSLREVAACIAHSEAYIGSSLHGMITACSFGRRGMLVASEQAAGFSKFSGFLQQLDLSAWLVGSWAEAEGRLDDLFAGPIDLWASIPATAAPQLDQHWARLRAALTGQPQIKQPAVEQVPHGFQELLAENVNRQTIALRRARAKARDLERQLAEEHEEERRVRQRLVAGREERQRLARDVAAERLEARAEIEGLRRELRAARAAERAAIDREGQATEALSHVRDRLVTLARSRSWRWVSRAASVRQRLIPWTPERTEGAVERALRQVRKSEASLKAKRSDISADVEPSGPVQLMTVAGPVTGTPGGSRPKLSVLSWDMGHNPLGRAYVLADVLRDAYEVEIVGAQFERYGKGIWEPLRDSPIAMRTFPGRQFPDHFLAMREVAVQLDADAVYVSKPRLPSYELGMLVKQQRNLPMVLDVDDRELAFFDGAVRADLADVIERRNDPDYRLPFGRLWTSCADGLIPYADALTVSNEALQRMYGGTIVPHARDERVFDPVLYDREEERERLGFKPADRVILFAGTPRQHKGILNIAKALDRIGNPDFTLAVFGTDEYRNLRANLADYDRWITVLPYQPFERLPAVLCAADLVCVLQQTGSEIGRYQIPAKITDALAMGVPCLTTRVPPLASLIERQAVEVLDDTPLEARIDEILTEHESFRRRAADNRSVFLDSYSYAAVRPYLKDLIDGLLNDVRPLHGELDRLLSGHRCAFESPQPAPPPATQRLPVRRQVQQKANGRPPMTEDGYDVVFFWKQNDTGLYGRRQDMFVKYLPRDRRVHQIIHFDAPTSVRALVRQFRVGPNARANHSNLMLRRTLKRVAGLQRAEQTHFYTYVHGGGSVGGRLLGREQDYLEYVRAVLAKHGVGARPTVFWVYPRDFRFPRLADALNPDVVVADVVDDHRTWLQADSPQIEKLTKNYEDILVRSDVVLANCEPVQVAMREFADEVHLVPNACEYPPPPDDGRVPRQLRRLTGPILGYVGNLSSRIDIPLLDHIAAARREWQIVLIGSAHLNRDVLALDRHPNVHFLGVKPYDTVPRYIRNFDVAIVPHTDDAMTRSMNPLKAYVYCSLGVPVVSTPIANLGDLPGLVITSRTPDEFITAVERALANGKSREDERVLVKLRASSWETRVERVLDLIEGSLGR